MSPKVDLGLKKRLGVAGVDIGLTVVVGNFLPGAQSHKVAVIGKMAVKTPTRPVGARW